MYTALAPVLVYQVIEYDLTRHFVRATYPVTDPAQAVFFACEDRFTPYCLLVELPDNKKSSADYTVIDSNGNEFYFRQVFDPPE